MKRRKSPKKRQAEPTVKSVKSQKRRKVVGNAPDDLLPSSGMDGMDISLPDASSTEMSSDLSAAISGSAESSRSFELPSVLLPDVSPVLLSHGITNHDSTVTDAPLVPPTIEVSEDSTVEDSKQKELERIALFESLISNKETFKFPTAWTRCDVSDRIFQAITFVQWTGRIKDGKFNTVCSKKVVLYKDMTVHAYVLDTPVEVEKLGFMRKFVSCPEEIEMLIQTFHKIKTCEGCAIPNSGRNFETPVKVRDTAGQLRHQNCNLMLDSASLPHKKHCLPCKKAKATLRNKTVRLQNQKDYRRLKFTACSPNKIKLRLMREKLKKVTKKMD